MAFLRNCWQVAAYSREIVPGRLPLKDINKSFDLMHAGESIRAVVRF